MKAILIIVVNILINFSVCLHAQTYFSTGSALLYKVTVNSSLCSCVYEELAAAFIFWPEGITFLPDTSLVVSDQHILTLDTLSGETNQIFTHTDPGLPYFWGLLGVGNGIFYQISSWDDELYRVNVITGEVTYLGSTGFDAVGDLTLYNGNIYYPYLNGIVLLDTNNTANSYPIVTYPDENYFYTGLTASHVCNSLIGIGWTIGSEDVDISIINLADGSITHLCMLPQGLTDLSTLTSMLEFSTSAPCSIQLDLDCNDSSGASGADFNSPTYNCLSDGVIIADEDITMEYDAIISTMTISVSGSMPDAPFEILISTGTVTGIDVDGSGTDLITLTNQGSARSTDFKEALRLIRYTNTATPPTPGPRTVEVQFTTASSAESNVAIAYIDVIESPLIDVVLGPDLQLCEGEDATFDAGHPGASYSWSNGSHAQTITVDESGQYSVTVSDGIHCPNADTVELEILPLIHIALTGDSEICDNETANLLIQTNTPFGLTIDVDVDPGSPFHFQDVTGDLDFIDLINQTTTYTITNVTPIQEACLDITDSIQIIDVYPAYIQDVIVSMCDGDSIWLGFYWETEAGVYENLLETEFGCDSMVTTFITILPAVMVQVQSDTCDPAAAGVFITHLNNPNGCDTVVTTTITLLPSDTTHISLNTCVWTQVGIVADTFSNQAGCDSLVIMTTSYIPPTDTTFLQELSCDSTLLGVTYDTLTTTSGCDSIVALTVAYSLIDTTYTIGTSCIFSEIGVFETLLTDASGCDSLVISTVTQGQADTTSLFNTSCDPASIGVFEELLTSSQGCDSLIVTTVTFSAQDSTFITSSTCDPSAAGVFITALINQFGCDSIVTDTVSLLPSDATSLSSTTCDPSMAGVFTQSLTNQYGCDSIVTETVTLLPNDQTALTSTTCIASQAGVFITTLTNQYGCDSIITETITLFPGDTTSFVFQTCDPAQVGNVETIYTGQDGCDSLVIETTTLFPLPIVTVQSAIDYNGFNISCAGDTDGSAIANASGTTPFTYLWSTTETDPLITGLSAGAYAVSVTDGNGCTIDGVITLTEPELFMIGFEVSEPDCFDQQLGSITVKVNGGVAPFTYSIDGTIFQSSPDFTGLSEGICQITSLDANDCSATEIISIDVPLMVQVELGDNQVISLGDSSLLQAIVNLPFDSLSSVMWTGIDSIDCPNCLTQLVAPIITTAYTVSVTSIDGCADRDSMTVSVTTDQKVFVPNIFSPNGDGVNDVLSISVGEDVQEISSFSIFDRWGNLVFGAEHILSNDPTISWDGKMKGEVMNPGVFTFKLVVVFANGEREVRYGDITLLR